MRRRRLSHVFYPDCDVAPLQPVVASLRPAGCDGVAALPPAAFAPVKPQHVRHFARDWGGAGGLSRAWIAAATANGTLGIHMYNSYLGLKGRGSTAKALQLARKLQAHGVCPRVAGFTDYAAKLVGVMTRLA